MIWFIQRDSFIHTNELKVHRMGMARFGLYLGVMHFSKVGHKLEICQFQPDRNIKHGNFGRLTSQNVVILDDGSGITGKHASGGVWFALIYQACHIAWTFSPKRGWRIFLHDLQPTTTLMPWVQQISSLWPELGEAFAQNEPWVLRL